MGTAISKQSGKRKFASIVHQKPRIKRMSKGKYNGKPVYDAKTPMDILISKADLVDALPGNPEHCAAAKSIYRTTPAIVAAHVYRSRVFVEYENKVERYITPGRLRQETISFDRGNSSKFMEGEYKILPPTKALKLGGEHRRGRKGGKVKTAVKKHKVKGARKTAVGKLFNKVH